MTTLTLRPVSPPGPDLIVHLGDGVAQPEGGGGWNIVKRPKRKSFVDWQGFDPWLMRVPIVLDGFRDDRSIAEDRRALILMMRNRGTPQGSPPVIVLESQALPLEGEDLRWVISNLEWGQATYNRAGVCTRQFFVVEFLEYVSPDLLIATKESSPAAAAQERAASSPESTATPQSSRTYTVKSGDTLWGIAVRELGKGSRYTEIVTLNNIRDPNNVKVGTVLRLP